MHPHPGRLPPGQGARAPVRLPVCQGRGGQLRREPAPRPGWQHGTASLESVEDPARGQHGEHPVRGFGVHAEIVRRGEHLLPVPAAVEQPQQAPGTPHPGQRDGAARIDPDLHGVAVTPYRHEPAFQRWPHNENARATV